MTFRPVLGNANHCHLKSNAIQNNWVEAVNIADDIIAKMDACNDKTYVVY